MPGGRPRKVRTGPKKPLSAYTLYVVEVRNTVSKENPELAFQEVAQKVGQMWRELADEHRQKYQQLAEQDKVRYEREKEEWKVRAAQAPPEEDQRKRRKRKGAPKNPLSAYTYYIIEVRKQVAMANPQMSFREVAVEVGRMWRNLTPEERNQYSHRAEQDKARYENEMADWNARLQAEAVEAAMETKQKKKKKPGPKNPLSAYTFFVMQTRPAVSLSNPKLSFGEVAARVGQMWRSLPAEERNKYDTMAREDKERYDREKESHKQRIDYSPTSNMSHVHHAYAMGGAGGHGEDDEHAQLGAQMQAQQQQQQMLQQHLHQQQLYAHQAMGGSPHMAQQQQQQSNFHMQAPQLSFDTQTNSMGYHMG